MIFMDFEASGLHKGSFPIQIGWAVVHDDRSITTDSHFIYCERWMEQVELWDSRAENIHHLSRAILKEFGKPPDVVASIANESLAGAVAHVDSPFDKLWSAMLFGEAVIEPGFALRDVAAAFAGPEIDERAFDNARKTIDRIAPKTHSADDDARHWAELYRMSSFDGAVPRA